MFKAAVLIAFMLPFINAKTINVAIDYKSSLDVFYNFKSDSSIIVTPVSTGLEISIQENGIYSNASTQTICQALSAGMIIVNVDKSFSNQLITWNSHDVYHLINPNTNYELHYDSVLLQNCGPNPSQTEISLSTTASITQTAVETYIGIVSTQSFTNYTTFIPINQYTPTIASTNASTTGYNRDNNTIAVVANALSTTATLSNVSYTNYSVSSVYTEIETVQSCINHAMGGCSLVTQTNVVSNGVTYTGQTVIASVYNPEVKTTVLQPVPTQNTISQGIISTQISGGSASVSKSTSLSSSQGFYYNTSVVASTTSGNNVYSSVSASVSNAKGLSTVLSAVPTIVSNSTITTSGGNAYASVSSSVSNGKGLSTILSAIPTSSLISTIIKSTASGNVAYSSVSASVSNAKGLSTVLSAVPTSSVSSSIIESTTSGNVAYFSVSSSVSNGKLLSTVLSAVPASSTVSTVIESTTSGHSTYSSVSASVSNGMSLSTALSAVPASSTVSTVIESTTSGHSTYSSVSASVSSSKVLSTVLSAVPASSVSSTTIESTTSGHSTYSSVSASVSSSKVLSTVLSAVPASSVSSTTIESTTSGSSAFSSVSTSIVSGNSVYTSVSSVPEVTINNSTITTSGSSAGVSTSLSLSGSASSMTTLIQQVSALPSLITVSSVMNGAVRNVNTMAGLLGLGLLINMI